MTPPLNRRLWQGPLPDPGAEARALEARIAGGMGYAAALAALRALARSRLPLEPALARAQAAWPWSIDLALVAEAGTPGDPRALARLEALVFEQGRRFGALAWAFWRAGLPERALAALAGRDPRADSAEDDALAEAELLLLSDRPAPTLPGPRGTHLSLRQTYRRDGAAGLLRRIDIEAASLPAHPPLWAWLIETLTRDCAFAEAEQALGAMVSRLGADHPAVIRARVRLALDREDSATARALLRAEAAQAGDADRPWDWPAPRHAQHLRCGVIEAADAPETLPALHDHAARARRLFPAYPALAVLARSLDELSGDWEALSAPDTLPDDPLPAARALNRLGLHEKALALMQDLTPATPDDRAALHRLRAETLLRLGRTRDAAQALGPAPAACPLAADHAYWASEIALAERRLEDADDILRAALRHSPMRMGLILNAARAAFLKGDDGRACDLLDRFRALKTAQLGTRPPDDLRDRITADARDAVAHGRPETASTGLAARAFARATPAFRASDGAIPRQLWHYWEGPQGAPVARGIAAWHARHPDWPQTVFDAETAHAWLTANDPALVQCFDALGQPAARADLFRLALLSHEGGVFTDLDEYPRGAVTEWLEGARAVLVIEEGHGTIANNFLAVEPGLPLLRRALEEAARNLAAAPNPYPWWDCGPAVLTRTALAATRTPSEAAGLRFLTQAEYDRRVATNLPFPHKRRRDHWR
ncbi:MAG: hypothetical protein Kow0013_04480 [Pararhodobacter sp.]